MGSPDDRAKSDDRAPWLDWPIGAKVVVRRKVDGGFSDVVGLLVSRDENQVTVHGRRGQITVAADKIALSKLVPPPVLGPQPRS
jgi:hypothetical protein